METDLIEELETNNFEQRIDFGPPEITVTIINGSEIINITASLDNRNFNLSSNETNVLLDKNVKWTLSNYEKDTATAAAAFIDGSTESNLHIDMSIFEVTRKPGSVTLKKLPSLPGFPIDIPDECFIPNNYSIAISDDNFFVLATTKKTMVYEFNGQKIAEYEFGGIVWCSKNFICVSEQPMKSEQEMKSKQRMKCHMLLRDRRSHTLVLDNIGFPKSFFLKDNNHIMVTEIHHPRRLTICSIESGKAVGDHELPPVQELYTTTLLGTAVSPKGDKLSFLMKSQSDPDDIDSKSLFVIIVLFMNSGLHRTYRFTLETAFNGFIDFATDSILLCYFGPDTESKLVYKLYVNHVAVMTSLEIGDNPSIHEIDVTNGLCNSFWLNWLMKDLIQRSEENTDTIDIQKEICRLARNVSENRKEIQNFITKLYTYPFAIWDKDDGNPCPLDIIIGLWHKDNANISRDQLRAVIWHIYNHSFLYHHRPSLSNTLKNDEKNFAPRPSIFSGLWDTFFVRDLIRSSQIDDTTRRPGDILQIALNATLRAAASGSILCVKPGDLNWKLCRNDALWLEKLMTVTSYITTKHPVMAGCRKLASIGYINEISVAKELEAFTLEMDLQKTLAPPKAISQVKKKVQKTSNKVLETVGIALWKMALILLCVVTLGLATLPAIVYIIMKTRLEYWPTVWVTLSVTLGDALPVFVVVVLLMRIRGGDWERGANTGLWVAGLWIVAVLLSMYGVLMKLIWDAVGDKVNSMEEHWRYVVWVLLFIAVFLGIILGFLALASILFTFFFMIGRGAFLGVTAILQAINMTTITTGIAMERVKETLPHLTIPIQRRPSVTCVVPLPHFGTYEIPTSRWLKWWYFLRPNLESPFSRVINTASSNRQIFDTPVIQATINFKWRTFARRRWFTLWFFPVLLLAISYGAGTYYLTDINATNDYQKRYIPFMFITTALSCYLLLYELRQMMTETMRYFISPYNYFDLLVYLSTLYTAISALMDKEHFSRSITSIVIISLYAQVLMQLRVFETMGTLIAIVLDIVKKLIPFLIVTAFVLQGKFNTIYLVC